MAMSVVPCVASSSGTSAVHSAVSTTTSSSPPTTSYQYQPPSTNGVRLSSKVSTPEPSGPAVAEATRCERPLAMDLYTVTPAPLPCTVTVRVTSVTWVHRRQYDAG